MRGRKPKPVKVQIAEGDPRKKGKGKLQEVLASEPIAARGLPEAPDHLVGRALTSWNFWREELQAMNLDSRPDAMMLEGACINYSRAVDADLIVAQEGSVVNEPVFINGIRMTGLVRKKKHPAVAVSNAAWSQVKAFCSEFGLSPVSRTRLTIEKKEDEEAELRKMLSRPRETIPAVQ